MKMTIDYTQKCAASSIDHVELQCEADFDVLTAWVMAAYRFDEFQSFPYICAIGPPNSGKTRLVKILHQLSYRGIFGAAMTASSMFRAIDRDHVSVYFDQCEHLSNCKEAPDLLAIIDNGYQEGGKKFLTNVDTWEYEAFELYSPKVFASTKSLEDTLESRSIRISMQAKTRDISIKIDKEGATILRSKLLLYKFRHAEGNEENEDAEATLMSITRDGRLIELFLPLYVVTLAASFPSGSSAPSAKIVEYLKTKNQAKQDEDQTSVEAQIIKAITECSALVVDGKLAYSLVVCEFNEGRSDKEKWGTKGVAKKIRDLGFQPCRMIDGSMGIYWDETLLKKHQKRFLINAEIKTLTAQTEVM